MEGFDVIVQRLGEPFDSRSRTLIRKQEHLHGTLMTEKALGDADETRNESPVSVNFSALTTNICFVVFHLFGNASYELAARVNLQHLGPRQRTALVNRLKCLLNFTSVF